MKVAFKVTFLSALLLLLTASQSHALEATLSWESVPGADYYILYWGTSSGNYTDDSGTVWGTAYTLSDPLLPERRYYFAVRAFNDYGGSGYSDEICLLGPEDFQPPYHKYDRGWAMTTGYLRGFKILYSSDEVVTPTLGPSGQIPTVDLSDLKPVGIPLDLEPSVTRFETPITVFVPCPGYTEVEDFSVCLYEEGKGWVLAWDGTASEIQLAAEDWLGDEPIYHRYDSSVGAATVEIRLHHFSGVQVAVHSGSGGVVSPPDQGGSPGATGGGCFISSLIQK